VTRALAPNRRWTQRSERAEHDDIGRDARGAQTEQGDLMPALRWIVVLAVLGVGLAACDDKQAQNNTATKPDSAKMEPQTDQSGPTTQKR
jgi:hypothetical protein